MIPCSGPDTSALGGSQPQLLCDIFKWSGSPLPFHPFLDLIHNFLSVITSPYRSSGFHYNWTGEHMTIFTEIFPFFSHGHSPAGHTAFPSSRSNRYFPGSYRTTRISCISGSSRIPAINLLAVFGLLRLHRYEISAGVNPGTPESCRARITLDTRLIRPWRFSVEVAVMISPQYPYR